MSSMSGVEASTNAGASASQSVGTKRSHEGDAGKPAKKVKPLAKEERQKELIKLYTEDLLRHLVFIEKFFKDYGLEDRKISTKIETLAIACETIPAYQPLAGTLVMLQNPIPMFNDNAIFDSLNPTEQRKYNYHVQTANQVLVELAKTYNDLLEDANSPPSAKAYAEPANWSKWQGKETAILNLRPSINQGLSLSSLHPVFARFNITLQQKPSDAAAMQVAHNLCVKMADAFENEKLRRDAFEKHVRPLFHPDDFIHEVPIPSVLERHFSVADAVLCHRSRYVLMAAYKLEFGTGDAYMQISRVYQTWVNSLKGKKEEDMLAHGAPMILICVMGPIFIAAGGFFDGKSVLVEPLAQPFWMLDHRHERQEQLASVLMAIKEAVQSLSQLDYTTRVDFKPGLPRTYSSFISFDGHTIGLTFESRLTLSGNPNRYLLFLATRADLAQQVLVKLIAGDGYGVAAHRKLAEADIAPALFGVATVEGAHTAYVMEYLSPKDGWTTLYEYAKKHGQDTISRIEGPVGRILRAMESEQIVHGDLRPNNIMVREIEDGLEMKVVDFDWAGTSGEVKYPFDRNMNISWPAEAGEPIVTEHDRWMVMNSLDKLAQ